MVLSRRPTRALGNISRSQPKVALLIETSNAYARRVLRGVVGYIREHEPWLFCFVEQSRGSDPPAWLAKWDGDGIIARIESPRIAKAVVHSKLPVVDVSAARYVPSIPWVETDDRAIAELAAHHFLERGFKYFAYCGDDRFRWSDWRRDRFVEFLKTGARECYTFTPPTRRSDRQVAAIEEWLRRLPKPLGVFACYDSRGEQVLDACRNIGFAVPDEVAVLGVDNDELLCELAFPPLSSIVPDAYRTGYEAARLLATMMRGDTPKTDEIRIPPLGIQVRQSTDVLATEDTQVIRAVQFIREHACDPIKVNQVLRSVGASRKALESRFNKVLNRSLHDEITRVRVDRVKQLLRTTDLPLTEIAAHAGFEHSEYMSVLFKRETGSTPAVYRRTVKGKREHANGLEQAFRRTGES